MANWAANNSPAESPPLETIVCPLCREPGFRPAQTVRNRFSPNREQAQGEPQEGTFRIVACISCGFLYLNPRPRLQDLEGYYTAAEYDPHRRTGGGLTGFLYRFLQPLSLGYKAGIIAKESKPENLLDVGSGRGEFLSWMRQRNWRVLGIEKDPSAAAQSQADGNSTLVGDPLDVNLPEEPFQVVTFWHSLEHLPDLRGVAARIAPRIKPNGLLVIAVPNPLSWDARFYADLWAPWDAPRHLYHFQVQDLQTLWEPQGFHLQALRSLPLDPFYASLLSEISWSSGPAAALRALRGLVIGSLSFLRGLKLGRGSSTVYLFRKM